MVGAPASLPSVFEGSNTADSINDSPSSPDASLRTMSIPNGINIAKNPSIQNLADSDVPGQDGGFLARAVIAPGVYYFGIVDILQTWSWNKVGERYLAALFVNFPCDIFFLQCYESRHFKSACGGLVLHAPQTI